jgi:hypothetical protein
MSKVTKCECADSNCPVHSGSNVCLNAPTTILFRIDMDDETGTAMCDGCTDDALNSGMFTTDDSTIDDELIADDSEL